MDSLEYKTIEKCYSSLVHSIRQSPQDLAINLRPLGILAPGDVSTLNSKNSSDAEKARKIVDIILIQVKTNPQVYYEFIEAMRASGDWTKNAVSELEKMHTSLSSADAEQCLPEDDNSKNNRQQLLVL